MVNKHSTDNKGPGLKMCFFPTENRGDFPVPGLFDQSVTFFSWRKKKSC